MLASALAHGPAVAAERTIAPDIRLGATYNENPRLLEGPAGDEEDIWGGFLDLGARAEWRTPTSSVLVRPRVYLAQYPNDDEWDAEDYYLDFAARRRGLRSRWALTGNYAYQYVLRGEQTRVDFGDPELDDPSQIGTGLVDSRQRRTLWRVRPEYAYDVRTDTTMGLGLNYQDASYSGAELGARTLRDYTDGRAEVFLERRISERNSIRGTIFTSRYEADQINNVTDSNGLTVRYESKYTEVTTLYVDLGVQHAEIEAGADNQVDISDTGYLLEVGGRTSWERTDIRFAGGRTVLPSGDGFLRSVDRFRLNLRHQIQPRWFGELGALVEQSDAFGSENDFDVRDNYRATARLGFNLTRAWTIEGTYTYSYQDYDAIPGSARSDEFFLSVNYQPLGRVWGW